MTSFHLRCLHCSMEFPPSPDAYVCAQCGGNCEVVHENLRVTREEFERSRVKGAARYEKLLPVRAGSLPPLPVGGTPLIARDDLAREMGVARLYIKDDGRLPSASFKDRASAVALARAREIGATELCGASTGNAAAATACLGAAAGIHPIIFVPRSAPEGKIAQLVTFGARLFLVDGSYDQAFDLSIAATKKFGWFNRNTGFNPYTREGKKTVSFELLEDLAWSVPDWVVVAVGDGNIISGVFKGFREAVELGLVDRMPRLLAAQSEKSNSVSLAVHGDGRIRPVNATTIADSISVDLPRDGHAAVRAVKESNGTAVEVSDEAILLAQGKLASRTGVFAEPAAACAFAAAEKAARDGVFRSGDSVVVLITGNGLKDIKAITGRLPRLTVVEPSIEALEKLL